jgi:hypothetical protein
MPSRAWRSFFQSETFAPTYRLWFAAISGPFVGVGLLAHALSEHRKVPLAIAVALAFLALSAGSIVLLRWRSRSRKEDAAIPIVHELEICRSRPHFYVQCSCGWDGDDRVSYSAALDDARAHGGTIPTTVTICDDPKSDQVYKVKASECEG